MRPVLDLQKSQKMTCECKYHETKARIKYTSFYSFKHAWANIDTKGTGYIQKDNIAKLLQQLTGPLQIKIYDDVHSLSNIRKACVISTDKNNSSTVYTSPKSPGIVSTKSTNHYSVGQEFSVHGLNKCLSTINPEETRKRRMEYNLIFKVSFYMKRMNKKSFLFLFSLIQRLRKF
jgi:hypothetical protein